MTEAHAVALPAMITQSGPRLFKQNEKIIMHNQGYFVSYRNLSFKNIKNLLKRYKREAQ